MEIREEKMMPQKVITDVICDCCGKSCVNLNNDMKLLEFMKLEATWGFGSNHDTEEWTAQLCEKCVEEKLKFVKFKKSNYL